MDGATNDQTGLFFVRSSELLHSVERAAKRLAEQLALDVVAYDRTGSSLYLKRIHGLPARQHDWPEFVWADRFCVTDEANAIDESVLLTMREPFIAQAALTLDGLGFDCR